MSLSMRTRLFLVAAAGFAALFLWGLMALPPFGHYRGPYGTILNAVAVRERHVTDVVAAVNFDYRGFDTIQEEYILFTAVAAVALLLRAEREEQEQPPRDEDGEPRTPRSSDAVRLLGFALTPPIVLLGLYIVAHGHLTPGGGFQGGVVLATAPLLIYLCGEYRTFRAVTPTPLVEVADALGAGGFVAIGGAGLVAGAAFLQNIIPLGPAGKIYSAGTIPLINLAVGLEVAAGILLILSEFLKQARQLGPR